MGKEEDALDYHKGGKIGTSILTRVSGAEDLALAYSPGVAVPCLEIAKDKDLAYEYTSKGNQVAVVSNGTAVLGLGNIGAVSSKPVMEGKALLFKHFGGIDAVDVELNSVDVDEIVRTIELISPTYGGINLEDFKAPECFEIEERLKESLNIPVMHDDQHGTAVVVGAGLLNALKIVDKKIEEVKVVMNGAGAAGIAIGRMMKNLGVQDIVMCDSRGVISKSREGLNKYKAEFAVPLDSLKHQTGQVDFDGGLGDAVRDADVFVGVSVKGALTSEMLKSMATNPIVFALANPSPEIDWGMAHEVRDDVIMATGRSDFPNQVNNVLAFPGIFRGALDSRAVKINEEMKVAAVRALASLVGSEDYDIPQKVMRSSTHTTSRGSFDKMEGEERKAGDKEGVEKIVRIIPDVFDRRVVVEVAYGVACAAVESGVAGEEFSLDGYRENLLDKFSRDLGFGIGDLDDKEEVRVGDRYRHFKGHEYEVVAVGRDSEDVDRRVVVYRGDYDSEEFGRNPVWVRDYEDFVGWKEFESGEKVRRFVKA